MDRLDFFQKHYFHELDRRNELTNALSIPLGVLVLLIGAITYFVANFHFDSNTITYIFGFLIATSAIAIVLVVYFQFRSYWNYEYRYISDSEEIREFHEANLAYHEKARNLADDELEEMLIRKYSRAATHNARNNDRKSANLHKSNTALVWLVTSIFLTSPFYFWNQIISATKQNVEATMPKQQDDNDSKDQQKPTEKPEKPKEPPDKFLKEADEGEKRDTTKRDE